MIYYWVPRVNQQVKAFWVDPTGKQKVGKVKGNWWKGEVIALTWPEEKGIPGVEIEYRGGHVEWCRTG